MQEETRKTIAVASIAFGVVISAVGIFKQWEASLTPEQIQSINAQSNELAARINALNDRNVCEITTFDGDVIRARILSQNPSFLYLQLDTGDKTNLSLGAVKSVGACGYKLADYSGY